MVVDIRERLEQDRYEKHRNRTRKVQSENSRSGRDIGELPPTVDQTRRDACEFDLRLYLETYHAEKFTLKWSEDHLSFIAETQRAILEGLLKVQAMPRGSGKTTIFECAVLWAVLYGHCPVAVLVAATDQKAQDNLESLAVELETNDLLLEDFPEACYPIRKLERISNRARGQTYRGVPTRIRLVGEKIVLPTIEGSRSSGAAITAAGLTGGGIRGVKHTLPDGRTVRPKVVLIDDPQTRKSAASASENRTRERIANGDVLGMAGPGESISVLQAVTVIYRGDYADRLLNRTLNPTWRGERARLMISMPSNMELWDQYGEIRANELRADGDGSIANAFYAKNRKAMDEGAVAAWPDRKLADELSAVQHAMNLYYANREAFFAEYQNEPLDDAPDGDEMLTAAEIMTRLSGVARGIVPLEADHLVAHIDVHDRLLYWSIVAGSSGFKPFVIDYGTWPKQPVPYFRLRDCRVTLADKYPKATKEGAIRKGLDELLEDLCTREFKREAGDDPMQLSLVLIDEGYVPKIIHLVCRRSPHKRLLRPAKGWATRASNVGMDDWKVTDGERVGDNWRIRAVEGAGVRRVTFDPNPWKSFTHKRLSAADGDPAALTLFGDEPKRHELIADHLTAEFREQKEGRGRKVDEWNPRPGKPDNHHFDNVVGGMVGLSVLGCKLADIRPNRPNGPTKPKKRRRRRGITYAN